MKEKKRKICKWIVLAVAILGLSTVSSAATLNYKLLVNGLDQASVGPGDVPIDSFFDVTIQVNVPDADFGGGMYGGCLQYSLSLGDSAGGLTPEQGVGGPPLFLPDGNWDSTSTAPMSNYKGLVDSGGYDVLGQTGQIPPGDFGTNWDTFGAGPGVWSTVGSGRIKWDGSNTTLTLVPGALSGQLVYGLSGGAENPTSTSGDSVDFVPEPATLVVLVLGGLGFFLASRRRCA